jgi:hypothetical protein
MKQQIEPAYATFEQGKLLKKKGFNIPCRTGWVKHFISGDNYVIDDLGNKHLIERPEQWQIVEWLRINHGIHVEVSCDVYGELWYANLFVCSKEVWEDEDKRHNILTANRKFINEHKSKQEAYSAAFDYILNELI